MKTTVMLVPNLEWKGMLCFCGGCVVGQIDFKIDAENQKYYRALVTVPGISREVGNFQREHLAMDAVRTHLTQWLNTRLSITIRESCV